MISPVVACSECTIVGFVATTAPIASVVETVIIAGDCSMW
jgi:hypothetical protein